MTVVTNDEFIEAVKNEGKKKRKKRETDVNKLTNIFAEYRKEGKNPKACNNAAIILIDKKKRNLTDITSSVSLLSVIFK